MRSITPLSYIYLLALATRLLLLPTDTFNFAFFGGRIPFYLLTMWAIIEAAFFPYYYLVFRRLNKINHDLEVRGQLR
jgi:uncharacterized membrane protein